MKKSSYPFLLLGILAYCGGVPLVLAQAPTQRSAPPNHRRHAVLLYPTRLINRYFPEVTVGYRYRTGPEGEWAFGIAGGPVLAYENRDTGGKRGGNRGVWGFGLAAEVRRYWLGREGDECQPYVAGAFELSRVSYDSRYGLAPVPGEDYRRVTTARTDSHRREFSFGLGADFVADNGLVVDVRFGLVVTAWRWNLRDGELADADFHGAPNLNDHGGLGYQDYDGDRRDAAFYPRVRVGFGLAR